jgi:hypothetical protein
MNNEVTQKNMIPKTIHYVWFGGNPLPELAQKCIASWKKYCPEYEIVEWNETNFDVNYCPYAKEAYEEKKWAFVSDVARLYALVNYGGIYMDTDVEVLKPLDDLLVYDAVSGFESEKDIPTGLMAARKDQVLFKELLDEYNSIHFRNDDGSLDLTPNVTRITNTCLKYGFVPNNTKQTVNGFTLLPKDYLCPKDYSTKELNITDNTLVIHHFEGSWIPQDIKYCSILTEKYKRILPRKLAGYVAKYVSILKYYGMKRANIEVLKWIKRK